MPIFSAGSASVSIVPDFSHAQQAITEFFARQSDVKVKVEPDLANGDMARIKAELDALHGEAKVGVDHNFLSGALGGAIGEALSRSGLDKLGGLLTSAIAPTIITALGGAFVELAAAASQAVGALALAPAILSAIAAPAAVVAIGIHGMGAAFKALDTGNAQQIATAMANLAPAAQQVVTQVHALGPAFHDMRLDVQQSLFAGVGQAVSNLAGVALPILHTGLVGIAGAMNSGLLATMTALQGQGANFSTLFGNIASAVRVASGAAAPLIQAFMTLAAVGSQFLPQLAQGFVNVATKFNDWVQRMAASGQLVTIIQNAINVLKELGQIAGNIIGVVSGIFTAALPFGNIMLKLLVDVTGQLAKFLHSTDGQTALSSFFSSITDAFKIILPPLLNLVEALVTAVLPAVGQFAKLLAPIAGTLMNQLADALRVVAGILPPVVSVMAALFNAMAPLIPVITQIVKDLLPPLVKFFGDLAPIIGQVATILGGALLDAAKQIAPVLPIIGDAVIAILKAVLPLIPALLDIAKTLLPPLLSVVKELVPIIRDAVKVFADIAKVFLQIVDKTVLPVLVFLINGLAGGLKVLAPILGPMAGIILAIVAAVKLWAAIQTVLDFALDANPIGLLALAIGALILVIGLIVTHLGALKTAFGDALGFIEHLWNTVWGAVSSFFVRIWNDISSFFHGIWSAISSWFTGAVGTVVSAWQNVWSSVSSFFTNIWNGISSFFHGIWSAITSWFTGAVNGVTSAWQNAWNGVSSFFQNIWNGISSFFHGIWSAITSWFTGVLQGDLQVWQNIWNAISSYFSTIWNGISIVFRSIWGAITSWFTGVLNALVSTWQNVWNGVSSFFSTIWNGISSFFRTIWGAITSWFTGAVSGVVSAWQNAWNTVSSFFSTIWNGISSFFHGIWSAISSWFTGALNALVSTWQNVWNGVSSFFSNIWNGISSFFHAIWSAISSWFTGALNAFVSFWQSIWNNVSSFFSNIWNTLRNFAQTIWNAIYSFFQNGLNAFFSFWSNIWNNVSNFFSNLWNTIRNTAVNIWNGITGFLQNGLNTLAGIFTTVWNAIKKGVLDVFTGLLAGIQTAWETLKGIVEAPIKFVINTVVNGFIHGVNAVMSFLHLPWKIPDVPLPFAEGGYTGDGIFGTGGKYDPAGIVHAREFVVNQKQTAKHLPLLQAINSGAGGYADGGLVGGIPSFAGGGLVGDIIGLFTDPVGTVVSFVKGLIGHGAGSGPFADTVTAVPVEMARNMGSWIGDEIKKGIQTILNLGGQLASDLTHALGSAWDAVANFFGFGGSGSNTAGFSGSGNVARWTGDVQAVLNLLHRGTGETGAVLRRIQFESGGNPNAINLTDSNARAGHPSQGLMQVIPSTFAAYRNPSLSGSIVDPEANIYAGSNYAVHRYGSLAAIDPLVMPRGYDTGGWLPPGYTSVFNGTRDFEAVLNRAQQAALVSAITSHSDGVPVWHFYLGTKEITDVVDTRVVYHSTRDGRAIRSSM